MMSWPTLNSENALGAAMVHGGFLGELKKLWSQHIRRDLRGLNDYQIYATGHSLGGVMATIAAMRWPFERVSTFGQPRVGTDIDKEFKGSADVHCRYVNDDDPVAKLPPSTWPFEYAPHGKTIRLDAPWGADVRFDHSILDYVDNLASA